MEQATDDTAPDDGTVRTVNSLRRDTYADSVALMRAARRLGDLPGVTAASLVMATEANLRLLADAHLLTAEAAEARPNDLIVAVRGDAEALAHALDAVDGLLEQTDSPTPAASATPAARSLTEADPATALALISTPGPYAAAEALKALRCGMHAFVFSDNVPLDQEIRLKREAHRAGLLAMGPDCGTAVIDGIPLGFANVLRPGRIGLIGASGTGLQQVSCLLDANGEGVRQMIGTGGRDLSADVGGITTLDALELLDADPGCELIVLVSKPPAPEVAERVLARAARAGKPVVACFLDGSGSLAGDGARPSGGEGTRSSAGDGTRSSGGGRVTVAGTLRDAAYAVVEALGGKAPRGVERPRLPVPHGHLLRALYAGGTFAYEARQLLPDAATGTETGTGMGPAAGEVLLPDRDLILDLGDDAYTAGRPHPMIDPTVRARHLRVALDDPRTAVVVLDVVLGHGAGADPAAALAAELERAPSGQRPPVVAFVVGTDADPQDRAAQEARLRAAGALLAPTSTDAIEWAAAMVTSPGHERAQELTTAGGAV